MLLGPDGLGLIGNVSGPSSIVPILLVGLGVGYAFHLRWITEDAYISFRTIDNFLHGHGLTWNPGGERVEDAVYNSAAVIGFFYGFVG